MGKQQKKTSTTVEKEDVDQVMQQMRELMGKNIEAQDELTVVTLGPLMVSMNATGSTFPFSEDERNELVNYYFKTIKKYATKD